MKLQALLILFVTFAMTSDLWPPVIASSSVSKFFKARVEQCVRDEYTETHLEAAHPAQCGQLCGVNSRCQAFSLEPNCQLFVFDRCSKRVRDCASCINRTADVFIKQRPGLAPTALCPADYASYRCGVKYKLYDSMANWSLARATIESEPGLTILSDLEDVAEMSYLIGLLTNNSWHQMLLGARQLPGSPEPAGGWLWFSCNASIERVFWSREEPNNVAGVEGAACLTNTLPGMNDVASDELGIGMLAECVSPFD